MVDDSDWSRWFAISSPPRICSFSFIGGVAQKKQLNLTFNFTIQSYILSTIGDALIDCEEELDTHCCGWTSGFVGNNIEGYFQMLL